MTRGAVVGLIGGVGAACLAAIAGWYAYQGANYVDTSYAWVSAPAPWVDAPTPGQISRVAATVGHRVRRGQTVMVETALTGRTIALKAPVSGIVGSEPYAQGSDVLTGAALFTVEAVSQATVLAEIPETSISRVSVGDRVTVTLDGHPGVSVDGRVVRKGQQTLAMTSPLISLTPFTKELQYVPIEVRLAPGSDTGRLVVGETASIQVKV
jgi:membrane fusion protein (multidrug efflux system)